MALGPQLAMVGDNPGRKEMIIPSEKFDMLGTNVNVQLSGLIRGEDLQIMLDRVETRNNRLK